MSLVLRKASVEDAALLHQFIVDLAIYERAPNAVKVTVEQLRADLDSDTPPFECQIAYWSGIPAGFALFFSTYSTWRGASLYLEDLFVKEEFRGRGIGRGLLRSVATVAVQRGCARLDWVVLDWNQDAIEFYERLGAKKLKSLQMFRLSDDALVQAGN